MFIIRLLAIFILIQITLVQTTAASADNALLLGNEITTNLGEYLDVLVDEDDKFSPFDVSLNNSDFEWKSLNQSNINLGYNSKPHWFRLTLDSSASIHKRWDLVLGTAFIDTIDVYQVFDEFGPRLIYRSGLKRTFDNRIEDHRFYIVPFEIFNSPNEPLTFLFRMKTHSSFYAPMTLYPADEFWAPLQRADIVNWLFYGVILAMTLYNFFIFIVVRDVSYLYYVLFIGTFAVLHLSQDGYIFQHFWPSNRPYSYLFDELLLSFSVLFAALFIDNFLHLKEHTKRLHYLLLAVVVCQTFVILTTLYYNDIVFYRLNTMIAVTGLLISLSIGFIGLRMNLPVAGYFMVAWSIFVIGNFYWVLALLGVHSQPIPALLVSKMAIFAETMLLSFALAQRIKALSKASEEQRIKAQSQSYFLAQVSHEIRTPLNGVIGTVELLDRTRLDEDQLGHVQTIKSSGKALLGLVNDVLDYSKIEAGKMKVNLEAIDIRELVNHQTALYRYQAREKGIELSIRVSNRVPTYIKTDGQRLRQIWLNLISNAVKFTKQGTVMITVDIDENETKPTLVSQVIDTGIGISKRDQSTLFKAYHQVDSRNRKLYGGTGLGLAISHDLIELLGGKLNVKSVLGQGSTFYFRIPFETAKQADLIKDQPVQSLNRALNILIAEDNQVNQRVIVGLLEKLGHRCEMTHNGQEAVTNVRENHSEYDLVLMDCEMPLLDGYEATRVIREFEQLHGLPTIPIVALTAHAMEDVRLKCIDAGMTDFLTKPIDTKQLQQKMSQVILFKNDA